MPLKIDENNLKTGLLGLVVALIEVIKEALEREAERRMETGRLREEEVDRLGVGLLDLDEAIDRIRKENGLDEVVDKIRIELDSLVRDSVELLVNPVGWKEAR